MVKPIVDFVHRRVFKRNQNFLGAFVGQTGSGKSYGALRFAELLSTPERPFNVKNVVLSSAEFMERLNSKDIQKGDIIIYDEAGVGQNNRQWQSLSNKLFNFIMMTFRYKNLVVIFTVPSFDFIDAGSRKLFHAVFQTQSIDRKNNKLVVLPKIMKYDSFTGQIRTQYLKEKVQGTKKIKIYHRLKLKLPDKALIEQYEAKKKKWAEKLNQDIMEMIKKQEASTVGSQVNNASPSIDWREIAKYNSPPIKKESSFIMPSRRIKNVK